jgi:hypothetical protein
MVPLPPDLSRLGDELTAAAGRALEERRRRRRLLARSCASALSGILTIAVLAPAALSPGSGSGSPLAQESLATVLVRPPDRPPPRVPHPAPHRGTVIAGPPDRRPVTMETARHDA